MQANLKKILIEMQTQIYDLLLLAQEQHNSYNELTKKLNNDFLKITKELRNPLDKEQAAFATQALEKHFQECNSLTDEFSKQSQKAFDDRFKKILENYQKIKDLS
ncbi:hypothetical protein ACT0PL_001872 [Campylobacter jejuni]